MSTFVFDAIPTLIFHPNMVVRAWCVLANGAELSVQASEVHNCTKPVPGVKQPDFEVWLMKQPTTTTPELDMLSSLMGNDGSPAGFVPLAIVEQFIDACGGIVDYSDSI